jgi:hypothetical protein
MATAVNEPATSTARGVPSMRPKVAAILASDLHLCHKPPPAREAEPDWYAAMARPLAEIKALAEKHPDAVVVYAGDIFDHWDTPAETINWVLDNLTPGYAVPGQHDLPNHSYKQIRRSAYATIVKAGLISTLPYNVPVRAGSVVLYGFPWEHKITCCEKHHDEITVAVCHAYIWAKDHKYTGAPEEKRAGAYLDSLRGYDVAVFGDNHRGFKFHQIFNCGTLMRRRTDEVGYWPQVGLLYDDGHIEAHYLDTSEDIITGTPIDAGATTARIQIAEFMQDLGKLSEQSLDFRVAVHRWIDEYKPVPQVRDALMRALG